MAIFKFTFNITTINNKKVIVIDGLTHIGIVFF